MLLLGIDIGTSSIKVSVVDSNTQQCIASAQYPETETEIISLQPGWAEQSPELWWQHTQSAILKLHAQQKYNPKDIAAIGIAYQMHGLVMVDKNQQVLRNSIIWCDSRAVEIGNAAFEKIGEEKCLSHLLNSPGNFTASKLAWIKQNEPEVFAKLDKIMLPGDFIAMKLTGTITTSISALSEGIFWDFKNNELSKDVFKYYGFDTSIIPEIKNVFDEHGVITDLVAETLSLPKNISVTYKAGDQPNNALSLNVLEPGEVAATAGTSGVIYGVSDRLDYDKQSRVNTFAHVNYKSPSSLSTTPIVSGEKAADEVRLGILLCINGTGILNRWVKNIAGNNKSYDEINEAAQRIKHGCDGLSILPFGNGAERMLNNKMVNSFVNNIDFNKHTAAHFYRAAQEGIAFAFRYGCDILKENGMSPTVIRAGKANLFLSEVFRECFVNSLQVPLELYDCDGSVGAAIGSGIGAKIYSNAKEAFQFFKPLQLIEPNTNNSYEEFYGQWLTHLNKQIN